MNKHLNSSIRFWRFPAAFLFLTFLAGCTSVSVEDPTETEATVSNSTDSSAPDGVDGEENSQSLPPPEEDIVYGNFSEDI
jgi:hypothetical protein